MDFVNIPDKPLCDIDEIKKMLESSMEDFTLMDYTIKEIYLPIMRQLVEKGTEMKAEQIVPLARLCSFVG